MIGYITVEPVTGTFMVFAGLSVALIIALLLTNMKMAIPLLLVPIPVFYPLNFGLLLANDTGRRIHIVCETMDIIPIVVFACFLLHRSIIKGETIVTREKASIAYLDIIFFILISLAFISVLWSPDILFYLNSVTVTFSRILIYLSLRALIKTDQDMIIVVKTWLVMSVVVVASTLISTLPFKSLNIKTQYYITEWLTLMTGFQGNRMRGDGISMEKILSEYTIIGTFLCLFLLSEINDWKKRILLSCLAISFIFSALLAQSKSAALGLVVGLLFLTINIKKLRAHMFSFAIFFVFICGALIIYERMVILPNFAESESSTSFTSDVQNRESLSTRTKMWNTCYNAIKKNDAFWLGLGGGGCSYYLAEPPHINPANPHSALLSFFFDFGITGIFLFLVLTLMGVINIFNLIRKLPDSRDKNMLMTFLSCAISVSFISLTELSYNYIYLWLLAGIGVSVYRLVASKRTGIPITYSQKKNDKFAPG